MNILAYILSGDNVQKRQHSNPEKSDVSCVVVSSFQILDQQFSKFVIATQL